MNDEEKKSKIIEVEQEIAQEIYLCMPLAEKNGKGKSAGKRNYLI